MTFLLFINLSALTIVPQLIAQRSLLGEYGQDLGLWGLAGILYLASALVKLLLEDALLSTVSSSALFALILRCSLGLLDAVALAIAISRRRALYTSALVVGLAWALMDAVSRRLLVFWFKAYGPEYVSEHLDSALVSQLTLVLSISIAVLVAIVYRKSELRSTLFPWIVLGVSIQPLVDFLSVPSGLLGITYGIPGLALFVGGVLTFLVAHRARSVFIGDAVNTTAVGTAKK